MAENVEILFLLPLSLSFCRCEVIKDFIILFIVRPCWTPPARHKRGTLNTFVLCNSKLNYTTTNKFEWQQQKLKKWAKFFGRDESNIEAIIWLDKCI